MMMKKRYFKHMISRTMVTPPFNLILRNSTLLLKNLSLQALLSQKSANKFKKKDKKKPK